MKDNLKGIKAIFFDAGGTLIHLDSSCICRAIGVEQEADSSPASPASPDNFRRAQFAAMLRVAELVAAGRGSTENLKREFYLTLLPAIGISREKLDAAVECALSLAKAEMLWRKADLATPSTLQQLRERGLRLAVVSNSDGRIEQAFHQAGLAEHFDFFIDSFLVGVEKPDPAIFLMAAERAGIAPSEAAYVGDLYEVDVIGARAAGLAPALYDPYHLNRNADCLTIRAIEDLLELI